MLEKVIIYGRIRAYMMKYSKLIQLNCSFPKLTETNQVYVLGLVEGLKYAQKKSSGKSLVKTPDSLMNTNQAFYNRSLERKTFP